MARIERYTDKLGTTWVDDSTVGDAEKILRRVPPWQVKWDAGAQQPVISSAAFDDDSDDGPMSVYFDSALGQMNMTAADTLRDQAAGFGVAALTVAAVREEEQVVVRDPDPGAPAHACDPAHGLVAGTKNSKRRKRLRNQAAWEIVPSPE
ncbi:MAG: hypothetical protein Q8K63_15145 [Acidimicrobiales bacterium]|nr:hypothetical protein [Acidimicrobiales bacterium]